VEVWTLKNFAGCVNQEKGSSQADGKRPSAAFVVLFEFFAFELVTAL
jgi:hypothetical protein